MIVRIGELISNQDAAASDNLVDRYCDCLDSTSTSQGRETPGIAVKRREPSKGKRHVEMLFVSWRTS